MILIVLFFVLILVIYVATLLLNLTKKIDQIGTYISSLHSILADIRFLNK